MKAKKNVLIVTDGSESAAKMTAGITAALKGNKVLVKTAADFSGTDILPADVFFLGCEKPRPVSFAYLEDLLKHINLAGRSCGVFSPGSEKTAKYLASLIRDSDAALNPVPLLGASRAETEDWAGKVVSGVF